VFKNTGLLKYAIENLADKARKAFYSLKSKNGNLSKVSRFKLKSVNQISDPYAIIGRITELYNSIQVLTENLSLQ
jgi:hypothetical protein